jgi:hypothetical protein
MFDNMKEINYFHEGDKLFPSSLLDEWLKIKGIKIEGI